MDTVKLLDFSALILLFSTGLLVVSRRLELAIGLLAFQSLVLAFISVLVAATTGIEHIYLASILTVLVKVVGATAVLIYVLRKVKMRRETGLMSRGLSLALVVGLILVSYNTIHPIKLANTISSPNSLPVAMSMVLIGLFIMVSRKKALMAVVGLITIENGLFLIALSTTYGMPLLVEFGIFFDVAVGVMLMGFFAFHINTVFETINTDELNRLKG